MENYELKKEEERIIKSGVITDRDREIIKNRSIAYTVAKNTGRSVIYDNNEELTQIYDEYPEEGEGITRDKFRSYVKEGVTVSETIIQGIEEKIQGTGNLGSIVFFQHGLYSDKEEFSVMTNEIAKDC